jgi:PKD repeat protein
MFKVISQFATTDIVFADSHGPYLVDGGSPVTLSAGAPNPHASYAWDLGDGTTATTPSVVQTYGKSGVYIAKLTVKVNQPGGDTSFHWALIRVRNVPPVVNAGPDRTVNEGDVVGFTGSFTDVQWLETHQATWDWGDSQKPDQGVVVETHNPSLGKGTVTASHAWGDSGVYSVTLSVEDKGGAIGRGRATVTVLNVPPTVDAGPAMFAYPCSVLTLEGKFTDPGWLDSHASFWDFGDGTGPQRAVVREKHDPPKGQGVAIASHVYHKCGIFEVTCVVIDDDGGMGNSSTVVRVVDVRNPGFEDGFCSRQWGVVGNDWEPYVAKVPTLFGGQDLAPAGIAAATGLNVFDPEEYCVHHGERAQRIHFVGRARAGILQSVGANPGWDYQIAVWYSLNEQAGGKSELLKDVDDAADLVPADATGGTARLGIDPTGGTDPASASIVWIEGYLRPEWAQLSVRATATANAITIFLEGQSAGRLGVDVYFDDATLLATQPFCPPVPPKPKEVCVDFSDLRPDTRVPAVFVKDKFTFVAIDKQPQMIVIVGPPVGQNGLLVHESGLLIELPFVADLVTVTVASMEPGAVLVKCFNTANMLIDQATSPATKGAHTLELKGHGIVTVQVRRRADAELIKICAHPESKPEQ